VSFETVRYSPALRAALVALLARVGTTQLTDEEFAWWFDRNPAGEGIVSLAVDANEVVGVAAMSFFRTALDGAVTRLAIPVNVATDPRYRGLGVFSTLERENEAAAAEAGSPVTVTFPNGASHPIFIRHLGWADLPKLRLWARPLRAGAVARYALGRPGPRGGLREPSPEPRELGGFEVRPVERFGEELDELGERAGTAYANHFVRDAEYFNWRYLDSPRDYRCFGAYQEGRLEGVAVVGHTFKHGVSAGFLADLVVGPKESAALRALLRRAVQEVRGGADALVLLPPPTRMHRRTLLQSGFLPTNKRLRFIGKALRAGARLDERAAAWHFTLGDFDFF
jgi:GNAT superfamily N-acetyltransferase